MKERYKPLLTPWKIGKVEIKNRIVLTSMGGTDLFGWMEWNHFDKDGARFILEVAKNNAGLVLPGCQPVYNPMYGQWLHKNKKMYDDLAKWMPEFHKTGAKLFVQLTAGFGRSFTVSEMMEKLYNNPVLRVLSKPVMDLDKITASASPSPNRWSDKLPSREMTKEEIQEFIDSFAKSSKLLKDAGVDGVEVHAVHEGYLLDQFTLHYVNKRTDEYGGSLENRYRFAAEIVKAIKAACGPDFPVSLRYSVVSKTKGFRQGALPGEDYVEAGRDMAESEIAAKFLQDAGYDMLNCDNGTYDAWYWAHPPVYMPENCNLAEVEHIKNFVDIPVVCAGRMTLDAAAEAVAAGKLDGAGFARNFLADPEWFTKVLEDREADIRPCILCHNGCFNMCHYKGVPNDQDLSDSLHLARCAVNAEMMQWDKHYIKKTNEPKTVHIVGGGIGGMEAARVLTLRGHKPIIYEKSGVLGGTFIAASSESYKGKLRDLLTWYRREMEKLGVEADAIQHGGDKDMEKKIKKAYPAKSLTQSIAAMAGDLGVGALTLTDIIEEMKKPARDPREDAPPVVFRGDVKQFEDLKIDMEMTGTVRNVVDFGAFVDIGVKNDGLVHISQLSDKFIKHPMDVVSVGDTVKVKIISIDYDKHRVGLTMKGLN